MYFSLIRTKTSSPKMLRVTLLLLALLITGLVGQSLFALGPGPNGGYSFELTTEAANRTAQGECYVAGAAVQKVCVQLCFLTTDGHVIPQNEFMCVNRSF